MNSEFFSAIQELEEEKGIPREFLYEKIRQALLAAFKKDNPEYGDNVEVIVDENEKSVEVVVHKTVVEQVEDPTCEIDLESAKKILRRYDIGDDVKIRVETKKFGRIAAQTAKQVIIQGIREAERGIIYDEFNNKQHEMLSGVISRIDPRNDSVFITVGQAGDTTDAILAQSEQIPGESYVEGRRLKVYVIEVRRTTRGVQIFVSRSHPGLVRRLFELEVPEIFDGTVEIRSIAREAGSRTKIAVSSNSADVDPVGACVGPRGARVAEIINELGGEKLDIVEYSDSTETYIANALAPAQVLSVEVLEDGKTCRVTVPDNQLSLAIGREGQNARLAAKLTGCKIDIKSDAAAL